MISGQQEHRTSSPVSPLKQPQQSPPPVLFRGRCIEQITGAQHGINRIALCDSKKTVHCFDSRSGEPGAILFAEGGKAQAEMPVGGM